MINAKNDIYTYFTQPQSGTVLLYNSEVWIRARLRLTTAGPVVVGTREELRPLLSGRGVQLVPDEEFEVIIPAGQRLFILAEAVHRVNFTIEPIPWLQQILDGMGRGFGTLASLLGKATRTKVGKKPMNTMEMPPITNKPVSLPHTKPYEDL